MKKYIHRDFVVFPAIDLRNGKVVRLLRGDPNLTTTYSDNPSDVAEHWCKMGAKWIHIVNLDGAFGESSNQNLAALKEILHITKQYDVNTQFGGGLRDEKHVETAFDLGINRVVLGTAAIETPELVGSMINTFGAEHIAVGIDTKFGKVYTHGWKRNSGYDSDLLAKSILDDRVLWVIFTDIQRDGTQNGINLENTRKIAQSSDLNIIGSGGVRSTKDIEDAIHGGLAGVIVGKALYEKNLDLDQIQRIIDLNTDGSD